MKFLKFIGLIGFIGFVPVASAFIGPSAGQAPGAGSGAISVDATGRIGIGITSPTNKLYVGANLHSSGDGFGLDGVLRLIWGTTVPTPSAASAYIWHESSDGSIRFKFSNGLTPLIIDDGGNTTGSFVGPLSGPVSSANVSSDVFGRLQGNGNFAFPASLGVATSSQGGLPQQLSVYGNSYISGSVGIGTTNPQRPLHIATGGGILIGSTSGLNEIEFSDAGPTDPANIVHLGNAPLTFGTNNTERVRIDAAGNVGIGTASPTGGKLHLEGGKFYVNYPTYPQVEINSASGHALIRTTALFESGIFPYSSTGGVQWEVATGWSGSARGADALFFYAGGERMAVDSDGTVYIPGNVGVGTASPAYKLDVAGQIRSSSGGFVFPDGTTQATAASGSGSVSAANVSSDVFGRLQGNGNFAFPASLGVGTNSQSGLPNTLSVYGSGSFTGNLFLFDNQNLTLGDTAAREYRIHNYNTTNSLWIENGGSGNSNAYLLLGTSFDWDRSVGLNYAPGTIGAGAGTLEVGQITKNDPSFTHGNTIFYTNGLERLRINNIGNVGIGTTAPQTKLHVVGSSQNTLAVDSTQYPEITLRTGGTVRSYDAIASFAGGYLTGSLLNSRILRSESGIFHFGGAGGANYLTINSGNVGIGTVTPGYKLDVAGNVNATQLCIAGVCQSSWPSGGGGDITSVNVGTGLSGGGASGDVTLFLNTASANSWSAIQTFGPGSGITVNPGAGFEIYFTGENNANIQQDSAVNPLYVNTAGAPIYLGTGGGGSQQLNLVGGNVGVGTANPTSVAGYNRFVVVDGGAPALILRENDVANPSWEFGSGGGTLQVIKQGLGFFPLTITATGNVGIGTPGGLSLFHVSGGYAQLEYNISGVPPSGDCDSNSERGRMVISNTLNRLYICNGATRGWDYTGLTN